MNKGIVGYYDDSNGFGFIKDSDTDLKYLLHSTGLKDSVKENDEVTFDLEEGEKGFNAINVKLVKKNSKEYKESL